MHFIARSNRAPAAATAEAIRAALAQIDADLELVTQQEAGSPVRCWVQGPAWYGSVQYRERAALAAVVFRRLHGQG